MPLKPVILQPLALLLIVVKSDVGGQRSSFAVLDAISIVQQGDEGCNSRKVISSKPHSVDTLDIKEQLFFCFGREMHLGTNLGPG